MRAKAVVLVSGGLDSAVTLFLAKKMGYDCHCLFFDYGQRHRREISFARRIARQAGAGLKTVKLDLPWKGSSLFKGCGKVPSGRSFRDIAAGVPSTYVPARNTVFLSYAASYAEAIKADYIFIGAHSEDSSGYPDCRAVFLRAFDRALQLGTKRGSEGKLRLRYPIIGKTKSEIIKLGFSLGVPFRLTWSCYEGEARPCMECDSCRLRAKGFAEAGINDALLGR